MFGKLLLYSGAFVAVTTTSHNATHIKCSIENCIIDSACLGDGEYVCDNPQQFLHVDNIYEVGFKCPNNQVAGQCVALVKRCRPDVDLTWTWRKGRKVVDNLGSIASGTLIATFFGGNSDRYDGDQGHAAIFIAPATNAIQVIDQWCDHLPDYRDIRQNNSYHPYANDANNFFTIVH